MNTSFFSFTYNLCYKKNNLLKSNNSHTLPSLASTDFQGPWPLTPPWLLRICSTCESQKDEWASALVWIFKIRKPRLRFTYPFTDYRESAYDVPRRSRRWKLRTETDQTSRREGWRFLTFGYRHALKRASQRSPGTIPHRRPFLPSHQLACSMDLSLKPCYIFKFNIHLSRPQAMEDQVINEGPQLSKR